MTVPLLSLWLGAAGLVVGSFLGLVSVRLPQDEDVVFGRSCCRACHRVLSWPDLVPVASFVRTWGRCRTCGDRIPSRYPLLELAGGGVGAWAAVASPTVPEAMLAALLGWQLLLIAMIDFDHHWLPDRLTLPLLATGLTAAAVLDRLSMRDALLGAVIGFVALWSFAFAYRRLRGRLGLGGGDPILFAAIGAWIGWYSLPVVLLVASLSGLSLVVARWMLGNRPATDDRLPFGVFLALGTWAVWVAEPVLAG